MHLPFGKELAMFRISLEEMTRCHFQGEVQVVVSKGATVSRPRSQIGAASACLVSGM